MTAAEIQTLINAAKSSEADLVTWTELRAILEGLKNQEGAEGDYTLDMLGDVDIDGFLDDTQVLRWNGTAWVNEVLTTDDIAEGDNLFFTISRSRNAISGGTGISYNPATGEITSAITQYTSAMARAAISLTTTGSGAATYNSSTGELNIPTPSSVNLYNSDGTLTGNRTVTMGGNSLTFTGGVVRTGFLEVNTPSATSTLTVGTTGHTNATIQINKVANANAANLFFASAGTNIASIVLNSSNQLSIGNTNGLLLNPSGGNVLINTTTDAGFRLDVNGTMRVQNTMTVGTSTEMKILTQYTAGGAILIVPSNFTQNAISTASNTIIAPTGRYLAYTTGVRNTLIGAAAGVSISSGSDNVLIGKGAGSGIGTGGTNVIVASADYINMPSATSHFISIHTNFPSNDASIVPATPHAFFGGGFNASLSINDFYFGQAHFTPSAASVPIVFRAPSGLGTDIGGANFTISAGRGTGTGTPGDVIFSTSSATTTGTTLQTLSTRMIIKGNSGNVGINTASPTYTLHVTGTSRITGNTEFSTASGAYMIVGATGDTSYRLSVDGDLRVYGKIRTGAPDGGSGPGIWKLGSSATGTFTLNTSQCLEVELNGTLYRIATLNLA